MIGLSTQEGLSASAKEKHAPGPRSRNGKNKSTSFKTMYAIQESENNSLFRSLRLTLVATKTERRKATSCELICAINSLPSLANLLPSRCQRVLAFEIFVAWAFASHSSRESSLPILELIR